MAKEMILHDPRTSIVDVIGTLVLVPLAIVAGSGVFALSLSFWAPTAGAPAATVFAAFWVVNSAAIAIIRGQSLLRALRARRAADVSTKN